MTGSLEYARARAAELGLAEPSASAASNGVLRDDQIDWIVANLKGGVSVSFDGLPSAHDRHRLTVLGQGSSERVMHTLSRFDAAGYSYGIRVTVTADQIEQLPDSVEYICEHFGTRRIQVEPAYQLGRWRDKPSAETEGFIAAYRLSQERATRHGREIFFSAARVGTIGNHFCGITQDTFALSPDGNVSSCYEVFSEDNPWSKVFFYGRPGENGHGYFDKTVKLWSLPDGKLQALNSSPRGGHPAPADRNVEGVVEMMLDATALRSGAHRRTPSRVACVSVSVRARRHQGEFPRTTIRDGPADKILLIAHVLAGRNHHFETRVLSQRKQISV